MKKKARARSRVARAVKTTHFFSRSSAQVHLGTRKRGGQKRVFEANFFEVKSELLGFLQRNAKFG
jgi:hypothetical protein